MYLIERIIGLVIYCAFLFVFFVKIYNGNYKNLNSVLKNYLIILAIMAFFFVPPPGADLYRIIPLTKLYGSKSIIDILTIYMPKSSTPIALLYYHIIGKIGISGLLPLVNTLIVYTNIFYVLADYSKKKNINTRAVALTFFFIMSTGFYIETISNIRTLLAYSILLRCFYNEMYNNKKIYKNIIPYIISILIHLSSTGIIIFRLLYYFVFENKKRLLTQLVYIIVLIMTYFLFEKYVLDSLTKLENYTQNGGYYWIWEVIKISILIITMLIILAHTKHNNKKPLNYIIIAFTIIVICMNEFSMFLRFNYFNAMMVMPIALDFYNDTSMLQTKGKINRPTLVFILCIIMLGISCTRGHLSSLKFFNIGG